MPAGIEEGNGANHPQCPVLRRTVTVLTEIEQCGITMRTGKLERQKCLVTPKNGNSEPYIVLSALAFLNPQRSDRSLLT